MEGMGITHMFNNVFKDKKVIVTGHTGFKGAWLSLWLNYLGANVVGVSKDIPTNPSFFEELKLEDKIKHNLLDIRNLDELKKLFKDEKPDFVFHLAAQPIVAVSYENPIETIQTNVLGTANVLESLRELENKCNAVIITSDKCYDNVEWVWGYKETDNLGGKDPYSASKGAAELIIKTYFHSYFKDPKSNIKLVSTRAGNVIGGGDWAPNRIVPDIVRAWSEDKKVKIRNPNSTRPWQHVLEPLSGYLRSAQVLEETPDKIHGEPFNFGPNSDQTYTVLEVLKALEKHWNFKNQEEQHEVENDSSFHEAGLLKLNCDKALFYLKWKPVLNFEQMIEFTGEWYNTFYHKKTDNLYQYSIDQINRYTDLAKAKEMAWT